MSDTRKYKDQGKFHNKILKADEVCESTKQMWDRHNGDRGEFRKAKKDLEEKIAEKEMNEEVRTVETNEHIDFDIPEQEEVLKQIMGRE